MAAREKGAHIRTRTRCVSARRSKGLWQLNLERTDGSLFSIHAKALVNAAGPWVDHVLAAAIGLAAGLLVARRWAGRCCGCFTSLVSAASRCRAIA